MKSRIIIPEQDLEPLSGESPAEAIHRAVIGRVVRDVPVKRAETSKSAAATESSSEASQ
ncbi:MAG: hypothetical protein QNJ19_06650 [Woeseiaceae bacterium]|nr:hypothetical protein [Woeseiaceae bacterium]